LGFLQHDFVLRLNKAFVQRKSIVMSGLSVQFGQVASAFGIVIAGV